MVAIQIADFFILKQNKETSAFSIQNLIIWLIGFVVYRLLMQVDIVVGNTLPDMIITIVLCVAVNKIRKLIPTKKNPWNHKIPRVNKYTRLIIQSYPTGSDSEP